MLQGHLHQLPKSKKWVVRYNRTQHIITELPVHPNDAKLLTKSDHLKKIFFQVETIAIGESEFDVIDCDVARLITIIKREHGKPNKYHRSRLELDKSGSIKIYE
jgi:hypothetical protein